MICLQIANLGAVPIKRVVSMIADGTGSSWYIKVTLDDGTVAQPYLGTWSTWAEADQAVRDFITGNFNLA